MRIIIVILSVLVFSCNQKEKAIKNEVDGVSKAIITDDYELVKTKKQEGLLILFPCFPCDAVNTKREFNIIDIAIENNISVLMMNFNQHLWLEGNEKIELEKLLLNVAEINNLNTENTFIGGFSGGGNVSLLLSNYLKKTDSKLKVKGVFIVDAPIDLLGLYESALKNIEKNYSEIAVEEARWIVQMFETEFGVADTSVQNYEEKSPYVSKTNSLQNLSSLNGVKIRLYTEPDTLWWKENRQADYEGMNAFYINKMKDDLVELYGNENVEYIPTQNRGYRSNGERHPHSWKIVDEKGLIEWVKEK